MIIKIPKHLVEIFEIVNVKQESDESCSNNLCHVQNTDETSTSYDVIDEISPSAVERKNEVPNSSKDVLHSQYEEKASHYGIQTEDKVSHYCIQTEDKQSFLCSKCGVEYENKIQFLLHVRRYHDVSECSNLATKDAFSSSTQNTFMCLMCSEKFNRLPKLSAHIRALHSSDRCYQCCQTYFLSMAEFIEHCEHIHCRPSYYPCTKCCKVYTLFECLETHLKVCQKVLGNKIHANCELCGNVFMSKLGLEWHLERHMGVFYPCTECGEIFTRQKNMYTHRTEKHYNLDFKCEVCFKCFHTFKGLKMHITKTYVH
uniref:Zinc finger protein 41 n=1 Tax=Cacopsylla melanoneura TaxID=428564 RepID=A0A8D9BGJ4_9HEMI